jgi:hypothetical protein
LSTRSCSARRPRHCHHRGRSQASRRQARYDHGSSHLGPDPTASSARPLRRSRRRTLT